MAPTEEAKQLTYFGSHLSPFVTLQLGLLLLQPCFLFLDLRPENRQILGYIVYVRSRAIFCLVKGGLVSSKKRLQHARLYAFLFEPFCRHWQNVKRIGHCQYGSMQA